MFIAILDFGTSPADRARALTQLEGERPVVRSMPGNLAFRVYESREDHCTVTVVHEWTDEVSFAAYLSSEAFARSNASPDGACGRPWRYAKVVSSGFT